MLHQVKASAGSGKTYTLTKTFLECLLQAVEQVGQAGLPGDNGATCAWTDILAVTFTNKAAAEMQSRVLAALKNRALGLADHGPASGWPPEKARQWLETIIRHLGLLNIRTIDSLLHQLIQQSALELELTPGFEPVFGVGDIFEPLYDLLVAQAEAGKNGVNDLLEQAGFSLLLVAERPGFLPVNALRSQCSDVFACLSANPVQGFSDATLLKARLHGIYDALRHAVEVLNACLEKGRLEPKKLFGAFLDKCLLAAPFGPLPTSAFIEKADLSECLLKASAARCTDADAAAFLDVQQAYARCQVWGRALRKAIELVPFVDLATKLLDELNPYQQRAGIVPASRWPDYAAGLLRGEYGLAEAMCRLGNQLRHFMIDEFQDTSRAQWDALSPLAVEAMAKGGSLFYVGDVKQAIYAWRGGDATLFDEIPDQPDIRAVAGRLVRSTLETNWRSAPGVVRFNNEAFGRLGQPETAQAVAQGLLPAAPATITDALAEAIVSAYADARQELPPQRGEAGGLVQIRTVRASTSESLDAEVKEHLRRMLFEDLLRRRQPGDICVLARSNNQALRVTEWLIEWELPVVTENSLSLAMHPLIRQAVSFLAFLDFPRNDLAFWEFIAGRELFGQVSGLDPDLLVAWLAQPRAYGTLHQAFQQDYPAVWTRWIQPFFRQAGLMGPYDLISELFAWYRILEQHPEDELFLRRFLDTVHRAEESGALSLAAFLDFWEEAGAEQRTPLPEHLDAIRVMTIHKAKGLEFPVVIVPYHNFQLDRAGDLTVLDLAGEQGDEPLRLLTTLHSSLGPLYYQRALPVVLEQLNLLYVAWTRAVDELYCLITRTPRNARFADVVHNLLVSCRFDERSVCFETSPQPSETSASPVTEDGHPVSGVADTESLPERSAAGETAANAADVGDLSDPVRLMDWLPRLKIFRSVFAPERFEQRRRGTLIHRCLEQLRVTGDIERDAAHAVQAGLRGLSNPHDPAAFALDHESIANDCLDILRWLLSQPQLADALAAARPEQELLDEQGAIHRLDAFVEHDTTPLVLEYKTGAPRPEHAAQLRKYLQLVGRLPGRRHQTPTGLLVYLDERRLEPVT